MGQRSKPKCIVFYGPSGVGKSTLIKMLMTNYPKCFNFAVSHTTRSIRPNEVEGKDYKFTIEAKFKEDIELNKFIDLFNKFFPG